MGQSQPEFQTMVALCVFQSSPAYDGLVEADLSAANFRSFETDVDTINRLW